MREATDTLPKDAEVEAGALPRHRREALKQVKRALAEDPASLDTLRQEIQLSQSAPREKAQRLRVLLERMEAERTLRAGGPLHSSQEGMAYLRVLLALGRTLEQCGKGKDAALIFEKALALAPGDPLDIRYHLARCLLDQRRLRELKALRGRYPEDPSALMAWIRLLEIQKSERQLGLHKALSAARQANAHVEDFLTSRCRIPKHPEAQDKGVPGSVEEALYVLDLIGEAWFSDRSALCWMIKIN